MWPWLAVSGAAIALVVGAQLYFARIADDAALNRDRTIVQTGIAGWKKEIADKSSSVTIWDEAVQNLANAFDADWAGTNVGAYFLDNDYDAAIVLNGDDSPVYKASAEPENGELPGQLVAASAKLIDKVRRAEIARGSASSVLQTQQSISEAVDATAATLLNGRLFILTAALVQPDFGNVLPSADRSAIILSAMEVDEAFVDAMSQRFLLTGAHMHLAAPGDTLLEEFPVVENREARADLVDGAGNPVGVIDWNPPQPGKSLLMQIMPPVIVGMLGLAGWAIVLYQRSRKATQRLVASEARAAHLAYHDSLTGLPNRAMLADRMAHALAGIRRGGKSIAVHCIDLDRFKEVNDSYGHEAGDELIRKTAHLLSKACRQSDTLARLGGDEFAIIQLDATPDTAAQLAERIVKSLAEPIDLAAGRLFIGASVGVSMIPDGNIEPAEGLRQADLALYRAKDAGRGRYTFFDCDMDASVKGRRALQDDLRAALSAKALELHYQPQVNGRSEIVGLEALVRWKHPTRGHISPTVFIPLAEESGLIDDLGMFTLLKAFEDRGGSVCLNRFRGWDKWISASVMLRPGLAAAG